MKNKPNYPVIITLVLFIFCWVYLVTRLFVKALYIDAVFALVIPILLGLMMYFIKKGK